MKNRIYTYLFLYIFVINLTFAFNINSLIDTADSILKIKEGEMEFNGNLVFDKNLEMKGKLIQSSEGISSAYVQNIDTRIESGFWQTKESEKDSGWPEDTGGYYHLLTNTYTNEDDYFSMQFAGDFYDSNDLYYRATNNNGDTEWNKIYHSGNTKLECEIKEGYDKKSGFSVGDEGKLFSLSCDDGYVATGCTGFLYGDGYYDNPGDGDYAYCKLNSDLKGAAGHCSESNDGMFDGTECGVRIQLVCCKFE